MNTLILILTIISLVLSIISDIISLQAQKKIDKLNINSELEITYTTANVRFKRQNEWFIYKNLIFFIKMLEKCFELCYY